MAGQLTSSALAAALAAEFGAAIEAVLGEAVSVATGQAGPGGGWSTAITSTGVATGTLTATVDRAGAQVVATRMMHLEEEPEEGVIVDMLRELWGQAASATALKEGFEGIVLTAGLPQPAGSDETGTAWTVSAGTTTLARLSMAGQVAVAAPKPAAAMAVSAPARTEGGAEETPGNLAALLDIDLPLVVRFARTELSLRTLSTLGPGSMVDMGRSPDDSVQVLIGSQVIAEGEVVVVSGNYGVRITSLVSPADRLRAMEL